MLKVAFVVIAAGAAFALAPSLTQAASIKDQLTSDQVGQACSSVPVGTVTNVQVTLPDGSSLSGSVHCEAENQAAALDALGTVTGTEVGQASEDDSSEQGSLSGTGSSSSDDQNESSGSSNGSSGSGNGDDQGGD